MRNDKLFFCVTCSSYFDIVSDGMVCGSCGTSVSLIDGVPVFAKDIYWGKVPEDELKKVIAFIDKQGFIALDAATLKKLDFTYHEDRADFRFYVPLSENSTVLDIGAGLGRITVPLARVCKRVVACDQSLSRMRLLSQRVKSEGLSNVDVFVGDIFNLPLRENSFDLIVMNGVLEWVGLTDMYDDPREAQIKSLEICKKLLKDGGHLYVGIENRFALVYVRAKDHGGLRFTSYMPRRVADIYSRVFGGKPYRTYTYSQDGYEKLFQSAGFSMAPNFYLLYPGYNVPRIIAPYENIQAFRYLIRMFKSPNTIIGKFIYYVASLPLFIHVYRFFFFSFGIIVKK